MDQQEIIRRVSETNPGAAATLEAAFAEQAAQIQSRQNRFPIETQRYANGTTWTQTSNGGIIVKGADNQVITGTEAIQNAIEEGRRSDLDDARARAAATAEGDLSVKQMAETSEALDLAITNAQMNDQFIRLLEEEGADATLWATYKPSWFRDNATIEFNQLARQAGLNVIASVTFGALSEAELKLAMDTAVPRFQTNEAAADYFRRRKAAQLALASELSAYLNYQRANPGKFQNKYQYEQEWNEQRREAREGREAQEAAAQRAIDRTTETVADLTGAEDAVYQQFLLEQSQGGDGNG